MSDKGSRLHDWLEALSRRERVLLIAVVFVAVLAPGFQFIVTPLEQRVERLERELRAEASRLEELQATVLAGHEEAVPRETLERRIAGLEGEVRALEKRVRELSARFAGPSRTAELLHTMLEETHGLRLVRLDRHAQEPQLAGGADSANGMRLLRRPVVLELEGSYPDVVAYLARLESLPWVWAWERFELKPSGYPDHRIRIVLAAYSVERDDRADA